MHHIVIFLIQVILVVSLPYILWHFCQVHRIMPLVMVQILVGILMGPSVLGKVAPEAWTLLFTGQAMTVVSGPAWLAMVLFAFLTGLHLQPDELRAMGKNFLEVSLISVLVPILVGLMAGYWLAWTFPFALGNVGSVYQFAIGIGLCMGVTALPVLGAILRETKLLEHRLGRLALGAAAVNDAILWFLLALLLMSNSRDSTLSMDFLRMPMLMLVYLLVMLGGVGPLLRKLAGEGDSRIVNEGGLVLVVTIIFCSALVAELVGLHATLGGFLAGVILPRNAARHIVVQLEPVTIVLLLPFFFTMTGMNTTIDMTSTAWVEIALLSTVIAMVSKIGGTAWAARRIGESWRDALTLGTMMQTKGMMEVVVLNILLEAGFISSVIFSALLVMAIATTSLTIPLLRLLTRDQGMK